VTFPLLSIALLISAGMVADLAPSRRCLKPHQSGSAVASSKAPDRTFLGRAVAVVILTVFLVPGPMGWLLAAVAGGGIAVVAVRRERRASHLPAAQAAFAAELLAACLAAGAQPLSAVEAVADAAPDQIARLLAEVGTALRLGADPAAAWAPVLAEPSLGGLGRAVIRSLDTGAPLADLLADWATELRSDQHGRARAEVQRAGIKIVLPVGLCFLPAFVLVGVLPVIAALIGPLTH
jgi:pilus assembly protein TadC